MLLLAFHRRLALLLASATLSVHSGVYPALIHRRGLPNGQRGRGLYSVVNSFLQYASLLVDLLVRVCFPEIHVVDIVRGHIVKSSSRYFVI